MSNEVIIVISLIFIIFMAWAIRREIELLKPTDPRKIQTAMDEYLREIEEDSREMRERENDVRKRFNMTAREIDSE